MPQLRKTGTQETWSGGKYRLMGQSFQQFCRIRAGLTNGKRHNVTEHNY